MATQKTRLLGRVWLRGQQLAVCSILGCSSALAAETHPQIPILNALEIEARCEIVLADVHHRQSAMESQPKPEGVLREWNRLSLAERELVGPLYYLANVSPDKATRQAADDCTEKFAAFDSQLSQSEALFKRVRDVHTVTEHERVNRQELMDQFDDAGVTLPVDKRARAKEIVDQLQSLSLKFEKNIRDDVTKVTFSPAEMAGMSDTFLHEQKRDADGNYVLPLSYPAYFPFQAQATNADARRRYYVAFLSLGGIANIGILNQMEGLRYELAQLHGDPDFATFRLRRRMAGTEKTVLEFLASVKRAVDPVEARDIAELTQAKADDLKVPLGSVKLERWDVSFYHEKVKKARFGIDEESLRPYFPAQAAIDYTLHIAATLYGVRFVKTDVPVWHPDVLHFDVYDVDAKGHQGAFVGSVYLDLYPREGKYTHAAAWPVLGASRLEHQTPVSALAANLDRNGLTQDELTTLVHEFGHAMHGVLARADYVDQAGTSVKWDFVEAPSQMFEEWGQREEPLREFAKVCPQCPQLSTSQIQQLQEAHKFGRGIVYARQWLLASYDMALSVARPPEALATWDAMEGATRLGHIDGTMLPASFGHITQGYASGYYGYMWSQVLALDMLSGFHGHLMDPVAGHRFRDLVLAEGGQQPPEELVQHFLGRKSSSDAFYQEITGQR